MPSAVDVTDFRLIAQESVRRSGNLCISVIRDRGNVKNVLSVRTAVNLTPLLVKKVADIDNIENY